MQTLCPREQWYIALKCMTTQLDDVVPFHSTSVVIQPRTGLHMWGMSYVNNAEHPQPIF